MGLKDYISNIPKAIKTTLLAGALFGMVSGAALTPLSAEEVHSESREDTKKEFFAVGYQNSNLLEGISVKVRPFPLLTLQGTLGFIGLNMNNPVITVDGGEFTLPDNLQVGAYAPTVGLRALFNLSRTKNLDAYVGVGAGLLLPYGNFNLGVESVDINLTSRVAGLQAIAGLEYRFDELPNLAFSSEIGFGYIPIQEIKGTISGDIEGSMTIQPNAFLMDTFLGLGIHYYF